MTSFKGKGIIASIVTPFNDDQSINKKTLRYLVNYLIGKGVHGIFVNSGAGEFAALSLAEKKELIEIVVEEVGGRIPVYAGTGAITTKEAIDLTQFAEKAGADAVSVIAPYSIHPSQEELYEFYKELSGNTNLPIILYNYPKRTGVNLSEALVAKLVKIDNIAGIKDSSGDFALTMDYIRLQNEHFSVFAGIDMFIFAALAYGARGSISSTAGFVPEFAVKIYEAVRQKDYETAGKTQNELYPLRKSYAMGSFPAVVKEALKMLGIDVGLPRKPIMPLSEDSKKELRKILSNIGVL
jgi:4-hydroxy-tetrahydrodipicolinate synthase